MFALAAVCTYMYGMFTVVLSFSNFDRVRWVSPVFHVVVVVAALLAPVADAGTASRDAGAASRDSEADSGSQAAAAAAVVAVVQPSVTENTLNKDSSSCCKNLILV